MADDDFETMKAACALITAGAARGTGYLVAPDRVVTCAHVVKPVGNGGTVTVDFATASMKATVASLDETSDAAVLNLAEPAARITPLKLAGAVQRKAPWDGYGFPGQAKGQGLPLEGAVMDPRSKDDQAIPVLLLKSDQLAAGQGAALHGFSGSPVLVQGFVVGHLKRYIKDNESPLRPAFGYVYATPSSDVLKLLGVVAAEPLVEPPLPLFPARNLTHGEDDRDYDVFISYRSTDRTWAMALFNRLEGAGFKVFIDQRQLLPGEPLANSLQTALGRSKSAVVLISKGWLESKWCQEEGNVLLHRTVEDPAFRVVPVRIDGSTLPPMWASRLWLDFANTSAPEGPAYRKLQFALIGQAAPTDDAVEARVFKAETEATDGLLADLRAAAAVGPQRVYELWQKWHEAQMPEGPANLHVAQNLLEGARPDRALEVLGHAKSGDRADQLRALALARLGRLDEAIEILKRLYDRQKNEINSETGGILAGRYKQRWLETGNLADLRASFEIYKETYERTKVAYPGINAAAMALQLGDRAQSGRIARQVLPALEAVRVEELDHYGLATLGEAYLLLNDLENARTWYGKAVAHSPALHQDIAVMRRQARRNLKNLGMQPDALDDVLYVPRVAAFSGHMVDAPGRPTPRFPQEKVGAVRKAIVERLKQYGIGYGFSSAARGSDLIFIEELRKRGGSVQVFLPFPRAGFKQTSVGFGWDDRFEKALKGEKVEVSMLAPEVPPEAEQPAAYAACNEKVFEAARQKAKLLDEEPILITVWNGNPGDGAGGTADAVRAWKDEGHAVDLIDISKLQT